MKTWIHSPRIHRSSRGNHGYNLIAREKNRQFPGTVASQCRLLWSGSSRPKRDPVPKVSPEEWHQSCPLCSTCMHMGTLPHASMCAPVHTQTGLQRPSIIANNITSSSMKLGSTLNSDSVFPMHSCDIGCVAWDTVGTLVLLFHETAMFSSFRKHKILTLLQPLAPFWRPLPSRIKEGN